jgi:hypothetical protein
VQRTNDGIDEEQATALIAKRRIHLVRTLLNLLEHALDDIVGAYGLPVRLGEGVEGETGVAVAAQAVDGSRVEGLISGAEGAELLVGGLRLRGTTRSSISPTDVAKSRGYVPLRRSRRAAFRS